MHTGPDCCVSYIITVSRVATAYSIRYGNEKTLPVGTDIGESEGAGVTGGGRVSDDDEGVGFPILSPPKSKSTFWSFPLSTAIFLTSGVSPDTPCLNS